MPTGLQTSKYPNPAVRCRGKPRRLRRGGGHTFAIVERRRLCTPAAANVITYVRVQVHPAPTVEMGFVPRLRLTRRIQTAYIPSIVYLEVTLAGLLVGCARPLPSCRRTRVL
jgi:hypothetical protein